MSTTISNEAPPSQHDSEQRFPLVILKGGKRLALPKYLFTSWYFAYDLNHRFDEFTQGRSVVTKGLRGHIGHVVIVPVQFWEDVLPFVSSLELDQATKGSKFTFLKIIAAAAAILCVIVLYGIKFSLRNKESSALATLNEEVSGLGFTVIAAMFAIVECFLLCFAIVCVKFWRAIIMLQVMGLLQPETATEWTVRNEVSASEHKIFTADRKTQIAVDHIKSHSLWFSSSMGRETLVAEGVAEGVAQRQSVRACGVDEL
ncbi:hypothetical protein EV421DRAFT_1748711 [Armillaria borealis]|uniref:Uncharacterized protein n=1 Tax=Armillaria borealis TaxID=47425 RepID=A0AA39ID28_9AGAR|nr:hypothetical protein EV421DRAFT_1748711 [Armillaria borealis]